MVDVELIDHGNPADTRDNDLLAALAAERGLPVLATNNVHYAAPERMQLAAQYDAIAARVLASSLSEPPRILRAFAETF